MEVQQHNLCRDALQQLIGFAERVVDLLHKDASLQVQHGIRFTGGGDTLVHAKARRRRGKVGRPYYAACTFVRVCRHLDPLQQLLFVPEVIAGRKHFRAHVEQFVRDRRRDAEATRRILPVHDAQVDRMRLHHVPQVLGHNVTTSRPKHIPNKQDIHPSSLPTGRGTWSAAAAGRGQRSATFRMDRTCSPPILKKSFTTNGLKS